MSASGALPVSRATLGATRRRGSQALRAINAVWFARQFDAVLHYDTTRAVEPMERTGVWEKDELPETYPTAL